MRQVAIAIFLLGCGGSEGSPAVVTETDTGATVVQDSSTPPGDSSAPVDSTAPIDTSTAADTAVVVADTGMAVADTAPAPMDAAGLKQGQCYTSSQCPSGVCRANAPGGICTCGGGKTCSSSTFDCNMSFGACVLDCTSDADCISGMQCTTSGCGLKGCMKDADCVATTVCRPLGTSTNKYCQRKLCPDGTGCPAGTTCLTSAEGRSCVETFLKF